MGPLCCSSSSPVGSSFKAKCSVSSSASSRRFSLNAGRSLSTEVHQDPPSLFGTSLVPATISCSHSISSYYTILWYQQPVGDSSLKLIGYSYFNNPTIEDTFKSQFNVTGDGSSQSELQVLNPTSGAYFCAASRHSDSTSLFPLQKPALMIGHVDSR